MRNVVLLLTGFSLEASLFSWPPPSGTNQVGPCLPAPHHHLAHVLASTRIKAFWNSVCSGHTLIKLILTLLGDEASEQMCVSSHCG